MFSPGFKRRQPGDFTVGPVTLKETCDPPAFGHCPVKGRGARPLNVAVGWEVGKLVLSGYSRPCWSARSGNRVPSFQPKVEYVPGAHFLDELLRGEK